MVVKKGSTEGKSGGWRSKSPADGILKISPWYGVHSSPVGVWIAMYLWGLPLASGQRFSQGSGTAGATVGNWRSGERVRMASYSKTRRSAASSLMGESGVGVRRTGEVGSEREERPKVLLEGAPLKAASRQGGRVGPTRGLPRMSRS